MMFVATLGKIPLFLLFRFLLPEPSRSKSSVPSPEHTLASGKNQNKIQYRKHVLFVIYEIYVFDTTSVKFEWSVN